MVGIAVLFYSIFFSVAFKITNRFVPAVYDDYRLLAIAVISAIPAIVFFFKDRLNPTSIKHPMGIGKFIGYIVTMIGMGFVFKLVSVAGNKALTTIGFTAMTSSSDDESFAIIALVYSCLVGPIIEELVYRGALQGAMRKANIKGRIFVSAFIFSIMHHDFMQSIGVFGVGLVLAYVADKHSIIYSIILHVINNCFVTLLIYKGLPGVVSKALGVAVAVCGVISVILVIVAFVKSIAKKAENAKFDEAGNVYLTEEQPSSRIFLFVPILWLITICDIGMLIWESISRL